MIEPTKPLAKFIAGGVSAALWENEMAVKGGETVKILKTSVSRRYKDRNGNWKTTCSFSRNEIPLAIYCLQKAFEAIIEKGNNHEISNAIEEERVI